MINVNDQRINRVASQKGMATILVVLMISLGMSVAAIGVIYSLRGGQQVQVAVHAKTNAQAAAWAGVDVFRRYLAVMAETPQELVDLGNLNEPLAMSIDGSLAELAVENITVEEPSGSNAVYKVSASIRSKDSSARASSIIQVQYRIDPNLCSDDIGLDNTLDFRRGLGLGGEITIITDTGSSTSSSLYVEGNVNTGGINLNGVSRVYATGNISIGSAVTIPSLFSNGDISLVGSANVDVARAVGGLFVDNGDSRINQEAYINGPVELKGGNSGKIHSLSDMEITGWGTVQVANTGGSVLSSGVSVGEISAQGHVVVGGHQQVSVDSIVSESDVSCSGGWSTYESIRAPSINANCPKTTAHTLDSSTTVAVMNAVQPFTMNPVRVDAWMLKDYANYAFWHDGDHMRVTVKAINGVAEGDYYLVTHNQTSYICEALNAGQCDTSAAYLKICNGNSNYNTCISYDTAAEKWRFDGKNMAPGVVWVEGHLVLQNGYYFNTFIATNTIETSGGHITKALNFAGYDIVCNNGIVNEETFLTDADGYQGGMDPFTDMYPSNLCDTDNGVLDEEQTIGNIALLAGGYPDPDVDAYEGGNIVLGASTEVFGSVLAGNYLDTGGDTTVHGYISASGLGVTRSGVPNQLTASTTVDLRSLPPNYQNSRVPNMDPSKSGSCSTNPGVSKVFWSRYL